MISTVKNAYRPESEYAKYKQKVDPSPRWRQNNVINLGLDVVEKISQPYNGPSSESTVTHLLQMDIDDEDERIEVHNFDVPGNPYIRLSEVSLLHTVMIKKLIVDIYLSTNHFLQKSSDTKEKKSKLKFRSSGKTMNRLI